MQAVIVGPDVGYGHGDGDGGLYGGGYYAYPYYGYSMAGIRAAPATTCPYSKQRSQICSRTPTGSDA